MTATNPLTTKPIGRLPRLPAVDAVRGAALAAMVLYHFLWDLTEFGLATFDLFGHPAWLAYRTVVVCLFLGLVGLSLVLARGRGLTGRRVAARVALLAGCAAAITLVSTLLFPESAILFGVLHHIALACLLGLLFLRVPTPGLLAAAAFALAAPALFADPRFDGPWLQWTGLVSQVPRSLDYVPLFPWFSAVLVGIGLGRALVANGDRLAPVLGWRPTGLPGRAVVWAGRNSLLVYMSHQPILIALVALFVLATGGGVPFGAGSTAPEPALAAQQDSFLGSCQTSCEQRGGSLAACAGSCRCMMERMTTDDLWSDFMTDRLSPVGQARLNTVVRDCVAAQQGSGGPP